mmetsp:Transcript_10231/g.19166  ORF Transcript_10231/g.19166 Transcript_10231/m.19166 type:complete len:922 (+) Transcript_10231:109-2874(+)
MPRLPAKQREAEKIATKLSNGSYAAAANDSPVHYSWEQHAKSLLSHMNGDRRKRKQTIDKFIAALVKKREEFRKEKKTGAGCATEAIEFYEYVLQKNITWKAKVGKKSSKDMRSPSVKNKVEVVVVASDGHDDVASNNEDHDTNCQVCGDGAELLGCSTCNLAFHLKCARPAMSDIAENEWSCAYCDATGVTDLKKDSRHRKKAIVAAREMNELKAEMENKNLKIGNVAVEKDHPMEGVSPNDSESANLENTKELLVDRCKICSKGGDLFRCSQKTCNHQFHVSCLRPEINVKPSDDWKCPYCDTESITGLKTQARKRRAAISAIKAMEKLAEDRDAKYLSDSSFSQLSPSKRKEMLKTINTDTAPVHPGRPRLSKLKGGKGKKQFDKEEEGVVNESEDDMETTGHGDDDEYDDAGDEAFKGVVVAQTPTAPTFTREQIPSEILKKFAPKPTNSHSRHGQYNCKFCMDDETTETCCFCACRICFTKHGKSNTILCDLCDGEYHISCLSPPLLEIPSFDWYCPTCIEAITKALNEPSARATSSKKGGKNKVTKSASKIPVKKGATTAKAKLALKRKKSAYSSTQPRTASGRFAPKPKPGEAIEGPVVKRGPGRPPKSASKGSPVKKTIRKKAETSQSPGNGVSNNNLQQRSRSGRVVKRKAAYDEREEGAQLLKVPKILIDEYDIDENSSKSMKAVPSAAATLAANAVISLSKDEIPETTLLDDLSQNLAQSDTFDKPKIADSPKVKQTTSSLSLQDEDTSLDKPGSSSKYPRRKPGARECMQISRRFGSGVIPQNYMDILMDYCSRGKVEHLIRMRERLDEHSRFLELQLAGLESLVLDKGNPIRVASKGPPLKEPVKSAVSKTVAPALKCKAPDEKNDISNSNHSRNVAGDGKKDNESIEACILPPITSELPKHKLFRTE